MNRVKKVKRLTCSSYINEKNGLDYKLMKTKPLSGLVRVSQCFGKDGEFDPLLESLAEAALRQKWNGT